jgi:hypothetical protein
VSTEIRSEAVTITLAGKHCVDRAADDMLDQLRSELAMHVVVGIVRRNESALPRKPLSEALVRHN